MLVQVSQGQGQRVCRSKCNKISRQPNKEEEGEDELDDLCGNLNPGELDKLRSKEAYISSVIKTLARN